MVVLTANEVRALVRLKSGSAPCGAALQGENDHSGDLFVLRNGMMISSVMLHYGSRQILRFHFLGDMLAVSALLYREASETITALSDCIACPSNARPSAR